MANRVSSRVQRVTGSQVLGCGSPRLHGSWVFGGSAGETPIPPENAPDIATEGRLHGFSVTGSWLGGFGVTVSSETATGPPDFPLTIGHGGSDLPGLTAHWVLSGFSLSLSQFPLSSPDLSVSSLCLSLSASLSPSLSLSLSLFVSPSVCVCVLRKKEEERRNNRRRKKK
jgi:hypothetical protein